MKLIILSLVWIIYVTYFYEQIPQSTIISDEQLPGIPTNATDKQITTAYKTLVLKYHPDRNPGNLSAAETYKAVCEAYKVVELHQQLPNTFKLFLANYVLFKVLTDSYQKQLYDESIGAESTPSTSTLHVGSEDDSKAYVTVNVNVVLPVTIVHLIISQASRGVDTFSPLMGRFVGVYSTIISRLREPIVVSNISPEVTDTAYTLCR